MISVQELSYEKQVLAQFGELPNLRQFILTTVADVFLTRSADADAELVGEDIALAAHEVCANIIDHAYGGEVEELISATLTVKLSERQIDVQLQDHGRGYDPQKLDWPPSESWRLVENEPSPFFVLEQVPEPDIFQERGRGVYLLTLLLDSVTYHPQHDVNYWHLSKKF